MNLPGDPTFNPTLPFDSRNERIAAAIKAYVDDLRVTAEDVDLAWRGSRQVSGRTEYFS